jgi:hypothetical protein
MKERTIKRALVFVLAAATLAAIPCGVMSQVSEGLVVGTVFNDTDLFPTSKGPVTLNIVVDRNFMGRIEPGETLDIALAPRIEPYELRAYVFHWDGSSFFAVVDLPLTYTVVVPISHRGRLSSFWVAFEGMP